MKPRIVVSPLCGQERGDWLNPSLLFALLRLQRDPRFEVIITTDGYDKKPHHFARNCCVVGARGRRADYLLMVDNDMVPPSNLADILHDAIATDKAIVTLGSGAMTDNGPTLIPEALGLTDGLFQQTGLGGGGVLIISKEVWEKIPGPWFQWLTNNDELGSRKLSEDYHFCELAAQHGFTVWTHQSLAGHLKTRDITWEVTH